MKVLIIRFSSFGDVLQTLSVAGAIHVKFPDAEIHWATRQEFETLIATHPAIHKVWSLPKKSSLLDLSKLAHELKREKFDRVYDAHNNLRSHLIGWVLKGFLGWRALAGRPRFLRRSIYRLKRFLLFKFRINLFPKPFSGQKALLEPLKKWGISDSPPPAPQLFVSENVRQKVAKPFDAFIALAPSAAFPLKRWPKEYFIDLIFKMKDTRFVLLGGPEDLFLNEIASVAPERVANMAGKLSLAESASMIEASLGLVSNDTGLMHVAEQIGKPCVALMGPAPFGFPCRPTTTILELKLWCRPCSKHGQGPCVNKEFQKCLRDIKPDQVASIVRRWTSELKPSPLPPAP
jgi:lipopolysaccharide heptosyltransferase II